jgi:hypothetical protein
MAGVADRQGHKLTDAEATHVGRMRELPLDGLAPQEPDPPALSPLPQGRLRRHAHTATGCLTNHNNASCIFDIFRSRSVEIKAFTAEIKPADQEKRTESLGALALRAR